MDRKNVLVAAGLLFLATACNEEHSVIPVRRETEVTSPKPVLVIPLDDSENADDSKGKPVKARPEVPSSAYYKAVMPRTAEEQ